MEKRKIYMLVPSHLWFVSQQAAAADLHTFKDFRFTLYYDDNKLINYIINKVTVILFLGNM